MVKRGEQMPTNALTAYGSCNQNGLKFKRSTANPTPGDADNAFIDPPTRDDNWLAATRRA